MLSWTITFLIIAIIAAALGFAGIAGTAAGIAKILFVILSCPVFGFAHQRATARLRPPQFRTKNTMKLRCCLLAAGLALWVVGCNQNKDSNIPDQQVANQGETNKLAQTKDQFMAATDKRIKDLDAKINDLSQRAANLKDDAKVQANKALDVLRADRDIVKQKYDDVKASSGDTWDKTKAAFQVAWADMGKAYDDAKAKFSSSGSSTNSPGNP